MRTDGPPKKTGKHKTMNGGTRFYLLSCFLANDVTLVTSYGYCQSLKINDIRGMSVLRFVGLGGGGVFCRIL